MIIRYLFAMGLFGLYVWSKENLADFEIKNCNMCLFLISHNDSYHAYNFFGLIICFSICNRDKVSLIFFLNFLSIYFQVQSRQQTIGGCEGGQGSISCFFLVFSLSSLALQRMSRAITIWFSFPRLSIIYSYRSRCSPLFSRRIIFSKRVLH